MTDYRASFDAYAQRVQTLKHHCTSELSTRSVLIDRFPIDVLAGRPATRHRSISNTRCGNFRILWSGRSIMRCFTIRNLPCWSKPSDSVSP